MIRTGFVQLGFNTGHFKVLGRKFRHQGSIQKIQEVERKIIWKWLNRLSSEDVMFDDTNMEPQNWLINNPENEFIETSAFRIAEPIAVGSDTTIVSTSDTKNVLKSTASRFSLHISAAVLHPDQEAILIRQTFYSYNFSPKHSQCRKFNISI